MILTLQYAYSVAKDKNFKDQNEDRYGYNASLRRFALCDGASASFDAKLWASLLSNSFVEKESAIPQLDSVKSALALARERFKAVYENKELTFFQERALGRGSFSTLICASLVDESLAISSVGDSLVFLKEDRHIFCFPDFTSQSFSNYPCCLSTISADDEIAFSLIDNPSSYQEEIFLIDADKNLEMFFVTDALAEYYLNIRENNEDEFLDHFNNPEYVSSQEHFEKWVNRLRAENQIKIDDTTLVKLSVEQLVPVKDESSFPP